MELQVGAETTIRLPGRATAGYRWTATVSGDAVSVSMSPASGGPSLPGAGADEIATIHAQRPGDATVTLELRRSWENEAQQRRVINVTVA